MRQVKVSVPEEKKPEAASDAVPFATPLEKPDPSPRRRKSPEVEETERQLADAISRADDETRRIEQRTRTVDIFENRNKAVPVPMRSGVAQIIENEIEIPNDDDMVKEKRELEEALDSTSKPGHQAHELERSEVNARRAFRLLIRFRDQVAQWEGDNSVIHATMWSDATAMLQREKDSGKRSKQITDADVKNACAAIFGDEYVSQERRRDRAKLTEKSLEHLADMWASKCRSLTALVARGR